MAVLQKIRNKGVLLVSIIALALFLFVAGDLVRGLQSIFQSSSQEVGEVAGNSLSVHEYSKIYDEWKNHAELLPKQTSFSEEQLNDQAWQWYVQTQLIKKQCDELGIGVSDDEIAEVIKNGNSEWLQIIPFLNKQGQYDYSIVSTLISKYKKLKDSGNAQLDEGEEKLYNHYLFAQRQIHDELLMQKYQTLVSQCFISNPVEAKMAFDGRTTESTVVLATLPTSSVKDDDVKVSDKEIKDKYDEEKEKYRKFVETRDIKIIDVHVQPNDADKKATEATFAEMASKLADAKTNTAAGNVTRQASSLLQYTDVYKKIDAFPPMIAAALDSAAVGSVAEPAYDLETNTYYTYKVLGKITQPDSVLFRQIQVVGTDDADIAKKADSIVTALKGGSAFADIAKKYNQPSDSVWFTTDEYQNSPMNATYTMYVNAVISLNAGETKKLKLDNGATLVLQALETANPVTKYNVAAVVKELQFSNETYRNAHRKLSSFLSSNNNKIEKIEANAPKNGYTVIPLNEITSNTHGIVIPTGNPYQPYSPIRGTRDALKWVFDEAKKGDAKLFECGNNDHLLVVALTGINNEDYRSLDQVKDIIAAQLKNEKKVAKLYESAKNTKSIEDAQKLKDARIDTLSHVSFENAPQFMTEPIVGAIAAKTDNGKFSGAVKGNMGVYMLKVLDKTKTAEEYNEKTEKETLSMINAGKAWRSSFNVLYRNAKVKDNRYKFF